MRLALVLVAFALVAPPALAQLGLIEPTFGVFANDPGRAFLPGTTEVVDVFVTYGPGQGGRPSPAPSLERPEDTQPTVITFELHTKPSWVDGVTFDPPQILLRMGVENGTQSSYSGQTRALLNVSPTAPALQREDFIVTATAAPNGNIEGKASDSPPLKLRATTVGKLNVSAEPTAVIPGGRWVTVPFTVRNEGNSDILARVNVTVRPENSQVNFEDTLELARNESKVVEVELRTPWTNAELGTLELEATPIVEGEEGTPARAEVAVRGESAVPGSSLMLLLVAVGCLALARRAKR